MTINPVEPAMPVRIILVVLVALAGACDDTTLPETTGVVQETNTPCTQETCACDREHHYTRQVTKACDSLQASISVCSDVPVCDQVIDAVVADVIACAEPASPFAVDIRACDAQ
jgi:hypothetical protein